MPKHSRELSYQEVVVVEVDRVFKDLDLIAGLDTQEGF